jgi:hypothetical protein
MAKWIPDSTLDLKLADIALANGESICNAQPLNYFQACHPSMWVQNTLVSVGDLVRPPTINGFIYECTVEGTTGAVEPGWGTTPEGTFTDGSVTWKTHTNYSLCYSPLDSGDKTIVDSTSPSGRKLTIAQKIGVVTHRSGEVSHAALVNTTTKRLHAVTLSETTVEGSNYIEAGRTTIMFAFSIISPYPS